MSSFSKASRPALSSLRRSQPAFEALTCYERALNVSAPPRSLWASARPVSKALCRRRGAVEPRLPKEKGFDLRLRHHRSIARRPLEPRDEAFTFTFSPSRHRSKALSAWSSASSCERPCSLALSALSASCARHRPKASNPTQLFTETRRCQRRQELNSSSVSSRGHPRAAQASHVLDIKNL